VIGVNQSTIAILAVLIPFVTYFTIWFGTAAYFRAKAYNKRKEVEATTSDNISTEYKNH
jgi:hypothetical protein